MRIIFLLILFIPATLFAKETYYPKLGIWLVETIVGPEHSDAIAYKVKLLDRNKKLITAYPTLVGRIILSNKNKQLFSCENNATMATNGAKLFNLSGKLIQIINHEGFLRKCGMTEDQKLYWLQYNKLKNYEPYNVVLVVNKDGRIIYRKINKTDSVSFKCQKKVYVIKIDLPEVPG